MRIATAFGGGNSEAIEVSTTLNAKGSVGRMDFESETFITQTIDEQPLAFSCKDHGADAGIVSPTMRAMPHSKSHANAGGQIAVVFDTTQITSAANRSNPKPEDPCHPLAVNAHAPAIVFNLRGREDGSQPEVSDVASLRSSSGGSSRSYAATEFAVRRLTVCEAARLQGFSDTYCHIKFGHSRKIADDEAAYLLFHGVECWLENEQWMTAVSADGNMYRAFGNGMAVPCMRWIGERIQAVEDIHALRRKDAA